MQTTTTIQHIIVMPASVKEQNFTLFQGFSSEVTEDFHKILSKLSMVPSDIMENQFGFDTLIAFKMIGSSLDIVQVREDLLNDTHVNFSSHFNVIWSTEKTIKKSIEAAKKFTFTPIHISCEKHSETIFINDLDEDVIADEIDKLKDLVIKEHSDKKLVEFLKNHKKEYLLKSQFPFKPIGHNCAIPSMKALVSCGYELKKVEPIIPSVPNTNINQHVEGITKLSNLIDTLREKQNLPIQIVKNDGIVYCPSFFANLYKYNSKFWNDVNRNITKIEREFIRDAIVRNKGYSNITLSLVDRDMFDPGQGVVGVILRERQIELALTTEIVSVVAADQFCPAIRIPNGVMLHHDLLNSIASLIKSPITSILKYKQKLNKKLIEYNEALRDDIGEKLLKLSFEGRSKLLTICDFPIEWISLNGFPLMFTHEISRIFPTPGNMLGMSALRAARLIVPYSRFTKILIIRSFDEADPIKDHLQMALDVFRNNGSYENLDIQIVNVSNEKELINALNLSSSLITIFDCHGGHGGVNEHSWLYLGKEKVDMWSLSNKCRISPIVILSACSTHPIDGSHASVANGLFRCGVVSVLGTYAPIDSIHASTFIARVLLRVSEFVPLAIENSPITWREVISGILRMSYQTDILRGLKEDLALIDEEQYIGIHIETNNIINTNIENWQDEFIKLIENKTNLDQKTIRKILEEKFQFVETMLYSQLGRPENIFICKDEDESL